MFSQRVKLTNLPPGVNKESATVVPFQDFLLFLFAKSSSTTPVSSQASSSSSQRSQLDRNLSIKPDGSLSTKLEQNLPSKLDSSSKLDRNVKSTIPLTPWPSNGEKSLRNNSISRRYSCPDFPTDTELYSSSSEDEESSSSTSGASSLEITEDEYDDFEEVVGTRMCVDLYILPPRPPEIPPLLSPQTSLESPEPSERKAPSKSSPPARRRRHDLSFYRNFSASTRSRSSFQHSSSTSSTRSVTGIRDSGDKKRILSNNNNLLSKRLTRSVPSKLNNMKLMMSRLKAMRLYYEQEQEHWNNLPKTRPPLSLLSLDEEKSGVIDPTLKEGENATVMMTTATTAATMSLFLDAVNCLSSQNQVERPVSPTFSSADAGIFYQ